VMEPGPQPQSRSLIPERKCGRKKPATSSDFRVDKRRRSDVL